MREKRSEKKVYSLVQTSWEEGVSSDVICFSSRKSILSGHHMICRSSQGLVLSLGVSHESGGFPAVWRHKGWFVVPDKSLPSEVGRILEVPSPTKNHRVAKCNT